MDTKGKYLDLLKETKMKPVYLSKDTSERIISAIEELLRQNKIEII